MCISYFSSISYRCAIPTTFGLTGVQLTSGVGLGSVTLSGLLNPSLERLYLCRAYREGDLEGEFLRRRRLSPCLARPGDLERDNDLDREDEARRPYLLPGDRDLPIFRCAPMHAARCHSELFWLQRKRPTRIFLTVKTGGKKPLVQMQ